MLRSPCIDTIFVTDIHENSQVRGMVTVCDRVVPVVSALDQDPYHSDNSDQASVDSYRSASPDHDSPDQDDQPDSSAECNDGSVSPDLPEETSFFCMVVVDDDRIFACGGRSMSAIHGSRSTYIFSKQADVWTRQAQNDQ